MPEETKRGFWGTLGDVLRASTDGAKNRTGNRPARSGIRGAKPQPKKPCGGCGSK